MGDLIVVEKVVEESQGVAVDCHVLPHPNVASQKAHGTISDGGVQVEIMASRKLENFEIFLNSVGDEKTVQIILLQIAHAVHHIHLQERVHGDIRMENLRVSESKRKVVLVQPSKYETTTKTRSRPTDIQDLREVFQDILQRRGISDTIYDHLCTQLTIPGTGLRPANILQHPYFWSTNKKLRFIAIIAQRSKEQNGNIFKRRLENSHGVFTDATGWIENLAINDEAERRLEGGRRRVMPDTIMRLANRNYDERHLWSLVNFMRNQWVHYGEKSREIRACFRFDPLEGYWDFFNRRYPNLLPAVYDVVKDILDQFNERDITEVYFQAMALNQDLPTLGGR